MPDSLTVPEGESATYAVALKTRPPGEVRIVVASAHDGVTVEPAKLVFAPEAWNEPRMARVSAAEDDDGWDEEVMIAHTASGGGYDGTEAFALAVTVTDDDELGIAVSRDSLSLDEGGSATYTVVLDTRPSAEVRVAAATGHEGVTAEPAQLVFASESWSTAQTVTVRAAQDDDGWDEEVMIAHTASGGGYDRVAAASVAVTVADDDDPGVTVSTESLRFDEGGSATYTVVLDTRPSAEVRIAAQSDHEGVKAEPAELVFAPDAWSEPRTVTVRYARDDDGWDEEAVVSHAVTGADYDGMFAASVAVTVTDVDQVGVTVSEKSLRFVEGGSATYTVVLDTRPSAEVRVKAASSHEGVRAEPAELVFAPARWSEPQTVIARSVADDGATDNEAVITHTASGADYDGVGEVSVAVTVTDQDLVPGMRSGLALAGIAGLALDVGAMNADVIGDLFRPADRRFGAASGSSGQNSFTLAGRRLDTGNGAGGLLASVAEILVAPGHGVVGGFGSPNSPGGPSGQVGLGASTASSGVGASGAFGGLGGFGVAGGLGGRGGLGRPGAPGPGGLAALGGSGGLTGPGTSFHIDARRQDGVGQRRGLSLWGQARRTGFSGRAAGIARSDGRLDGWYGGADYTLGRATLGVAVARHRGRTVFSGGANTALDSLGATMTSVLPYARVSPWSGGTLWGAASLGWGDATFSGGGRDVDTSLGMRMAAVGAASDVARLGALVFGLRADGMAATTGVDEAGQAVEGLRATVQRGRVAATTRAELDLSPFSRLVPSVEAGLRIDRGDAVEGLGMEVGGGLQFTNVRLGLDLSASGRWLASHEVAGYEEWGANVMLRMGSRDPDGRGLSMSLTPSWGAAESMVDALWRDGAAGHAAHSARTPGALPEAGSPGLGAGLSSPDRLAMDVSYGLPFLGDGLVDLFGQSGVEGGASLMRVGTRLRIPKALQGQGLSVELLAERAHNGVGPARHLVGANLAAGHSGHGGHFVPFAEFRFEDAASRRLRVGAAFANMAVEHLCGCGLRVHFFGEHLARRGVAADHRLGVSASLAGLGGRFIPSEAADGG